MERPRYFCIVLGDPTPPDRDRVEQGAYRPAADHTYRYLPLATPIERDEMLQGMTETEQRRFKALHLNVNWLFELAPASAARIVGTRAILWPQEA